MGPARANLDRFRDRRDAGRRLAAELRRFSSREDVIVLALPRGGVPVAYEVAVALKVPLDVCVVRKLGVPGHEELAMGAIASGGTRVVNERVAGALSLDESTIAAVAAEEQRRLEERERLYRGARPPPEVRERVVLLVDDGLATGSSMSAAVRALRGGDPAAVIVAVPVAPPETCRQLGTEANEVVCLLTPELFQAVGLSYDHFGQTTDDEVAELLERAHREVGAPEGVRESERG